MFERVFGIRPLAFVLAFVPGIVLLTTAVVVDR